MAAAVKEVDLPTFASLCAHVKSESGLAILCRRRNYIDAFKATQFVSANLRICITVCVTIVALIHVYTGLLRQIHNVSLRAWGLCIAID